MSCEQGVGSKHRSVGRRAPLSRRWRRDDTRHCTDPNLLLLLSLFAAQVVGAKAVMQMVRLAFTAGEEGGQPEQCADSVSPAARGPRWDDDDDDDDDMSGEAASMSVLLEGASWLLSGWCCPGSCR